MTIRIVDSYVNRDDSDQYAVYVSAEIVSVKEDEESVCYFADVYDSEGCDLPQVRLNRTFPA